MGPAESAGALCRASEKPQGPVPSAAPLCTGACAMCVLGGGEDQSTRWAILVLGHFVPRKGAARKLSVHPESMWVHE